MTNHGNDDMIIIKTSLGDIKVKLHPQEAPETVKNFMQYVKDGHYNNTIFHRVIDNFVIQGGGMTPELKEKPTRQPIVNEADNRVSNARGTLSMARTMSPNSATSQFFINLKDNTFLDHRDRSPQGFGYCVFGEIIDGMEVVEKIRSTPTTTKGPYEDVPVDNIVIKEVVSCKNNA